MSNSNNKQRPQRALVLQGGGTLGAYEAGVIKVLCENLMQQDRENREEEGMLFDIVAGTSIGAMNGAILVSQFLKTRSWKRAAEKLEKFWTEQLSLKSLDVSDLNKQWHEQWMKRNPTAASEEAARRYYSVLKLVLNLTRNNMYYQCNIINDTKFFSKPPIPWHLHSSKPLQESIEKYAKFPIATTFSYDNDLKSQQQPRLLVFSVDVAEGMTVTFDSYPKKDGLRRSTYGKENKNVIHYNDGINIHHIMASGTLPEFYDYAPISVDPNVVQKNQDENCRTDISDKNTTRYFWDGGLLSNTPFRELLQAHQEYWEKVEHTGKIPDLDVYIVNVHPIKMDINTIPSDYDGIVDREKDIIFGDRTSHHDEERSRLITDYANFVIQLKDLADKAISKIDNKETKDRLNEKLRDILTTKTYRNERNEKSRTYDDLMRNDFKLNKVIRIERTNYINSISGKIGDLTIETISKLIKEGERDAWFSFIQKNIEDIGLSDTHDHIAEIQDILIKKLNQSMSKLRSNDYEDHDSQVYQYLTEFIDIIKNQEQLESDQSEKLIRLTKSLMAIL